MRTRPVYGNCPLGAFYLLLRLRAAGLVVTPGGNWLVPWHLAVLTRQGHCLNFYRLLPHADNTYGAWWFLGSSRGLRRGQWRAVLGQRGRIRILPTWLGLALCGLGYLLLCLPWNLAWLGFTTVWSAYWSLEALWKRGQR